MRLYGRWTVTLPGEEYVWEPDETTVAELLLLESELGGMTFDEWITAVDERKAVPCQVLVWYLRRKAGRQEDRFSVDFPIRRLKTVELVDDPEAPAGSDPATDPSSSPEAGSDLVTTST